jgi:hypothetical protein
MLSIALILSNMTYYEQINKYLGKIKTYSLHNTLPFQNKLNIIICNIDKLCNLLTLKTFTNHLIYLEYYISMYIKNNRYNSYYKYNAYNLINELIYYI